MQQEYYLLRTTQSDQHGQHILREGRPPFTYLRPEKTVPGRRRDDPGKVEQHHDFMAVPRVCSVQVAVQALVFTGMPSPRDTYPHTSASRNRLVLPGCPNGMPAVIAI